MPRKEVVEHVWDALQRSDWDPTKGEWTLEQIEQLVADLERNPPAPLVRSPNPYTYTDDGNAQRFADRYWETIRWVPEWKTWVFWRGDRWAPDAPEFAIQQMLEIGRTILRAAADIRDDDGRKRELRWGNSCLSEQRVRAALALAKAQPALIARPDDFDGDPWLLNCQNGTLDLRTGTLREHRREDMLLQQAACEYRPETQCEDWNRVLRDSFESTPDLVEYIQRVFGYALTGDTSEEKFFFFFGKSGAGKGTILESFGGMLGSYTRSMNYRTLTSGSHQSGSGPTEDVARLHRARFVVASEFEKNQPLAEAFVSTLTGRDTITARFLHQGSFEFRPELTLFLSANHKPKLSGSPESGVWRRLQVVTFDHKVQQVDKKLKSRLGTPEARAAIFAWAVAGCLRWQAEGLGEVPESMQGALEEYQAESDPYSQFLRDATVESPASSVTKEDLFDAYLAWAIANGINRTTTKQTLGRILKERGVDEATQETRREDGKRSSQRVWRGIALKPLGARLLGTEDAR
jgi:putative DNA primase/helicase